MLGGGLEHLSTHHDTHIGPDDEPASADHPAEIASVDDSEPPAKKRKVADGASILKSLPRPVSPPWKRVSVDGPTSFVENGRRKSGRTNVVPLELQPQSDKRQTRAAAHKVVEDKIKQNRPSYNKKAIKSDHDGAPAQRSLSVGRPTQSGPGRPPMTPRSPVMSKAKPELAEIAVSKHWKTSQIHHRLKPGHARKDPNPSSTLKQANSHHQRSPSASSSPEKQLELHVNGFAHSEEESSNESTSRSSSPKVKLQKIKLRVQMPKLAVQSPANIPLPKRFSTFQEFLEKNDTEFKTGDDILTSAEIAREAQMRNMVRRAQKRGRNLDAQMIKALPDPQKEPPKQWAHYDHLVAHILHFRKLLNKEHQEHKRQAKKVAEEAVKYLERKRLNNKVKTAGEIEQEEISKVQERCRQVVRDLEKQWSLVEAEMKRFKLAKWEAEQQALGKEHLKRVLEQHTQMLETTIARDSSDVESGNDRSGDDSERTASNDDESNMSSTDSESETDESNDNDADLTPEELQRKYASLPAVMDPENGVLVDATEPRSLTSDGTKLQQVTPADSNVEASGDESDPSIDMDSDITESDSDASDKEEDESDESNGSGSEDDDLNENPMLGFLSKSEIAELKKGPLGTETSEIEPRKDEPDPAESVSSQNNLIMEIDEDVSKQDDRPIELGRSEDESEMHLSPTGDGQSDGRVSGELSTQASPRTSATKASEVESFSSIEPRPESQMPATPPETKSSTIKTPVPSLLRGTLREYQHEGLDWLADLYANNRNGILADEMGLGKTIQSIALLAHLAVEHEVWGPHLIIVPTSVMLNWEMEFKKFCPGFKILTYYGTQEERKQKRRGWQRDCPWNVLITSYQLVLQDQTVFKRHNWHYMILDEAHNIKNFRSQRWQTMLTFKTRARLLLTGTPLQNNLTELWSLLFFLRPTDIAEDEDDGFAGLKDFSEWFRKPVDQILEHGRETMDDEAREQVTKLHKVIRPYLLRRLKADVEKQMPGKYEHVELCRLSKRQRQLYDGFMSRAQTKETLASGNYLSIINCLMQLRKVCNHPDLFETRPVTTSFAMSKSATADFEIQDLLVRRRLMQEDTASKVNLEFLQLVPISREDKSHTEVLDSSRLMAFSILQSLRGNQYQRTNWKMDFNGSSTSDVLASLENIGRKARMSELERDLYFESQRHRQRPIYGKGLIKKLTLNILDHTLSQHSVTRTLPRFWDSTLPSAAVDMVESIQSRSSMVEPLVSKFGCITPAVVAPNMVVTTLRDARALTSPRKQAQWSEDPFHEARTRLSIAFPDKRLLQYDCGKLQRLDRLLRDLQAGGHRALIFTQMTKVLDILEQFLNIHGHRYLRLDGATKIEQRQILTDRFNNDTRILAFILSSRSGGLGINLTGADTVIFYDLDWNPAMDKQCTDRAHRIGQTRDVHIYRFVSEHTIESNILRKANQKRMLDDVVIQEGDFTTDYFNKLSVRDMLGDDIAEGDAEASAAMDRVLGNDRGGVAALEQVEDREDIAAARVAEKEVQLADDADFDDTITTQDTNATTSKTPGGQTPGPFSMTKTPLIEADEAEESVQHIDEYMLRLKKWLLDEVPIIPVVARGRKPKKKGGEHRLKRIR